MRCPHCRSTKIYKHGTVISRHGRKRRYWCQKCGATFYRKKAGK